MKFRLAHFRNKHDLTQVQVAEILGISQGLYNQLESGKRRMNQTVLEGLADYYNIHPNELIVDEAKSDPAYYELDEVWRRLTATERRIVVNSAKGVLAARERT